MKDIELRGYRCFSHGFRELLRPGNLLQSHLEGSLREDKKVNA